MNDEPLVSVIIPTLDAGKGFDRMLDGVRRQQVQGRVELVVIDSESRDGTAELASQAGARVLRIQRRLFNHGRARNQAIAASTAKYVVLTVQDAVPADSQWLGRLLSPLLAQQRVGGSYGLQAAPSTAGLLAKARSSLWREAFREPRLQSLAGAQEWSTLTPQERLERIRFDNVTSCLRRSTWDAVPFPESRFGEEMGWAKAAIHAGHEVAFVPEALVWHSHERDWWYEMRRSYADGANRVRLVGWPSAGLGEGDVVALMRRLAFFARTRRFDGVCAPSVALLLMQEETRRYQPLASARPAKLYLEALDFALDLTKQAIALLDGRAFGKGEWVQLLRFALAATAGRALGTTAAARLASARGQKAFWAGLDRLLLRAL